MTNPNDSWRHQSPAAPHAPPHDRLTPGLPLQPGQSAPYSDASADAYQPYTGPVNAAGASLGVNLLRIFTVLVFSGPIFGSLYPLATGVAVAAGLATNEVLRVVARGLSPEGRLPIAMLATLVVFWPMSRLDHRLALIPPYRMARHAARVFLIGSFISLTMLNDSGGRWLPTSIAQIRALASDQRHLVGLAVGAVIGHLILTRAKRTRERWHGALELARLRPR